MSQKEWNFGDWRRFSPIEVPQDDTGVSVKIVIPCCLGASILGWKRFGKRSALNTCPEEPDSFFALLYHLRSSRDWQAEGESDHQSRNDEKRCQLHLVDRTSERCTFEQVST